ncbi:unnamed protein product [Amoebophrya sp. A25]|nr:unnamed protein product [Amoebophrya sp. A25]|eukprot:GSA25T00008080001.1
MTSTSCLGVAASASGVPRFCHIVCSMLFICAFGLDLGYHQRGDPVPAQAKGFLAKRTSSLVNLSGNLVACTSNQFEEIVDPLVNRFYGVTAEELGLSSEAASALAQNLCAASQIFNVQCSSTGATGADEKLKQLQAVYKTVTEADGSGTAAWLWVNALSADLVWGGYLPDQRKDLRAAIYNPCGEMTTVYDAGAGAQTTADAFAGKIEEDMSQFAKANEKLVPEISVITDEKVFLDPSDGDDPLVVYRLLRGPIEADESTTLKWGGSQLMTNNLNTVMRNEHPLNILQTQESGTPTAVLAIGAGWESKMTSPETSPEAKVRARKQFSMFLPAMSKRLSIGMLDMAAVARDFLDDGTLAFVAINGKHVWSESLNVPKRDLPRFWEGALTGFWEIFDFASDAEAIFDYVWRDRIAAHKEGTAAPPWPLLKKSNVFYFNSYVPLAPFPKSHAFKFGHWRSDARETPAVFYRICQYADGARYVCGYHGICPNVKCDYAVDDRSVQGGLPRIRAKNDRIKKTNCMGVQSRLDELKVQSSYWNEFDKLPPLVGSLLAAGVLPESKKVETSAEMIRSLQRGMCERWDREAVSTWKLEDGREYGAVTIFPGTSHFPETQSLRYLKTEMSEYTQEGAAAQLKEMERQGKADWEIKLQEAHNNAVELSRIRAAAQIARSKIVRVTVVRIPIPGKAEPQRTYRTGPPRRKAPPTDRSAQERSPGGWRSGAASPRSSGSRGRSQTPREPPKVQLRSLSPRRSRGS